MPHSRNRRPRPKRRLSQNFLTDPEVARQIVDLTGVGPKDTVLEIGPGTGALTGMLVERAGLVHAVEVDKELFERLQVEWKGREGLVLHHGDVLKSGLRDLIPEGRVTVVGNLPYHITSDLMFWLLREHAHVRRAVVMMQKEVARRIVAEPGTRAAGAITLAIHYRCEADLLIDVPPYAFRPVPKVTSTVVALRFRDRPAVSPADEALFFRVIRAAFGKRRKTLANALAGGLALPRDTVETAATQAGLDPKIRGERLTLDDFARLADVLMDMQPPERTET